MNHSELQLKIEPYARWVLEDCSTPLDEIEWLARVIYSNDSEAIKQARETIEWWISEISEEQ